VDKDALGGVQAFVKGLLTAGAAVADLVFWAASRAIEITREVTRELLAAGATMASLITDTLAHPGDALPNLMRSFLDIGKTLKDVVQSALIQPSEDLARRSFAALKQIGQSALDMLTAAFDIGGSAVMLALVLILEWFPGDYRPLTADEHAQAALVFGKGPQLDEVRIAVKSIPEDIIEKINGGRALTAMYVLNFPPGVPIQMPTLIHELTHVWQGVQTGPLYMLGAICAMIKADIQTGSDLSAYNYGFDNNPTGWNDGTGGEAALTKAGGNLSPFNPEQQAMIIQHYYVRRFVEKLPEASWQPWQPYAEHVFTA
jgi:hypothetical protein